MARWQSRRPAALAAAGCLAVLLPTGALTASAGATTSAHRTRPRSGAPAAGPAGEHFAAAVTIRVAGQKVRIALSGEADRTTARLDVSAAGTRVRIRRIGDNCYVHLPASLHAPLPPGKTWGLVKLPSLEHQLGLGGALVTPLALGGANVLATLEPLLAGPPRQTGTATIRSTRTTAYAATLDLSHLGGVLPASEAAVLTQLLGGAAASLPFTVWVDSAGRLRQIRLAAPLTEHAGGMSVTVGINVLAQVWGYGRHVEVHRPPVGEVAPLPASALQSRLGLGVIG